MELSDWFKGFEDGVSRLSPEQREVFFSACGEHCVKSGTLQVYRELHAKAGGDLDVFFLQANELPGVKAEIVGKIPFIICISWNVLAACSAGDTFQRLCFASVPGRAFFMCCIRCGRTGDSG